MASDVLKTTLFGLVLFVLFTSLILTVAVDFGDEYNQSAENIGGESFNLSLFQNSAENVESNATNYRTRFEDGEVGDIDNVSGFFSVVTDMINLITTPFQLLGQILINVLNFPAIAVNIILGLLAISLILAVWSLIKKGD